MITPTTTEERLRPPAAFELLLGLSNTFINLGTEEIDGGIHHVLETIGRFVGVDRAYVFRYDAATGLTHNTHEWCAPGITPQIAFLQDIPFDAMPYLAEQLRRREVVHIARLSDLPDDAVAERELLEAQGIRSLVMVPMVCRGTLVGFLGFDSVHREACWDEESVSLLSFVGDMFVHALERKAAAETLRQSESNYREFIERAALGIYRSTVNGQFLDVNPALVRMLGYDSREEVLRLDLARDVYADPVERQRLIDRYGDAAHEEIDEVRWKRKDGNLITVRLAGRTVMDDSGSVVGFEMMAEDVTGQRALEAQLRQAQKMEAIGQLTGGIAHDFNNILTVILAHAELVASRLPPDLTDLAADVEELHGAAQRGTEMVKKLLGFSRRKVLAITPLDAGDLVTTLSATLRRVLPEHIEISIYAADAVPMIRADAGALEQILLNLATNARDAMPEGGHLRLEVQPAWIDEGHQEIHGWGEPGEYVGITVSDTGVGMDAATRKRLFEPFFTTKPAGTGTGLGMAMVYGLVKQHDGFINIYSEPDAGTTVKLYFRPDREATPDEAPESLREMPRGSETVLLVEDEEAIRRVATRILEQFGYTVLAAADGEEALEIYHTQSNGIALVISDVVMPRMGGRVLHDRLRAEGATAKFLFSSGYTARDVRESTRVEFDAPFIHKPWTTTELLTQVRRVLDAE